MSLFVLMAGDLTMEHALFVTALTEKTKGSVHYSYALSYKVDCAFFFFSLNCTKSLDGNHSVGLGFAGVPEAVPGEHHWRGWV